jgi:hypothetical protein
LFIAEEGQLKKKIIKMPPEIEPGNSLPADKDGKEEPRPTNVGGIFKKIFNPPDEKTEE